VKLLSHDGFACLNWFNTYPIQTFQGEPIRADGNNSAQCSLRHIPGDLDALQKGKSLILEKDTARREQESDRSHSERKNHCHAAHGPDFFSSIQLPARAVSGTLHETAWTY
jgi:hypothetical protein